MRAHLAWTRAHLASENEQVASESEQVARGTSVGADVKTQKNVRLFVVILAVKVVVVAANAVVDAVVFDDFVA